MTKFQSVLVIATGLVQIACGESIAPPTLARDLDIVVPQLERAGRELRLTTRTRDHERNPVPSPILIPVDEPDGGGPGTLPPEWQQLPTILTRWTDSGFLTSGAAYAQGFMKYFASHATQELRLGLRFNNATVARTSGKSEQSSFWPWYRDMVTDATVYLDRSCGHATDASTYHLAWHQPPTPIAGLTKWGTEGVTTFNQAAQPPCPREIQKDTVEVTEPDPDGGAGGGDSPSPGGGWYTCYYYYEYYTDTGEIVYSAFLGCSGKGGV